MNRRTMQLDGEPQNQNGGGEPAPDLMGYGSVDDLVRAKRASDAEVKRLAQNQQALETRLLGLEQRGFQGRDVPQRSGRPQDRLADLGIPSDAIEELVQERIGAAFAPLAQAMQARNTVMAEYPDYAKHEANVAKFIASEPELQDRYNRMFQSDPVGALDYGILKYAENQRAQHKSAPQRGREPAEVAEAQIPSSRSGDARRAPAGGPDQAKLEALANRYRETGTRRDAEAYVRERLHSVIKDEHLTA